MAHWKSLLVIRNCSAFQISRKLLTESLSSSSPSSPSLFHGTLPSPTIALRFLAQRRWPRRLPTPPSVAIVFVGHGDFASGRLVKAWLDYRAVWWMEGRPQTPFTWEQKPESGWIEGLSICLSLKKLKNFLQRLTNPPAPLLSLPLTFFFLLDPLFPPSLSLMLFFHHRPPPLPLSIALSLRSKPPSPLHFFLSLLSPTIQSVILDLCVSRMYDVWLLSGFLWTLRLSREAPT